MKESKKIYTLNGINYIREGKNAALKSLKKDPSLKFFLVGSKVSPNHFHSGFACATVPATVNKLLELGWDSLEQFTTAWEYYNSCTLGTMTIYLENRQ